MKNENVGAESDLSWVPGSTEVLGLLNGFQEKSAHFGGVGPDF